MHEWEGHQRRSHMLKNGTAKMDAFVKYYKKKARQHGL